MESHDGKPVPVSETAGMVEGEEAGVPTLTESLLALGLLVVTGISCWLLYGQMIRFMPTYIGHVIGK
ncbi:hypothetical protein LLG95_08685 [bacterium]|nr:hypothetical protein [bacterium]